MATSATEDRPLTADRRMRGNGRRSAVATLLAMSLVATSPAISPSPAAAQEGIPHEEITRDEIPQFTGDEFNELFAEADLPNLRPLGPAPSITGDPTVDQRIRSVAEGRGYTRRPLAGSGLVWVDGAPMQPAAAAAWRELTEAAAAAGHQLRLTSAYRNHAEQRSILLSRLAGYSRTAIDTRLRTAAPPGYSKHHTGYAVDVSQPGYSFRSFADSPAYAWLAADNFRNAKVHGWIPSYPPGASDQGPIPEPWEYTYVGLDGFRCWEFAPTPANPFCDDDHTEFSDDIEWLASTGVSTGCNPPADTRYCPAEPVTRGQMAAFLHRALADRIPTDLTPPDFTDTADTVFTADITWLAATGITTGCNPPANTRYCPAEPVTRGQMAAFLHRALG